MLKPSYSLAGVYGCVYSPIHMVKIDTSPNIIQLRLSSLVSFYKSRFDFSEKKLTKISESLSMVPKIPEDF